MIEPKLLANISIRIVAIYLAAQGIMQVPSIATVLSYGSSQESLNLQVILALSFAILTPLIFGIFMWAISNKLSSWVVGDLSSVESENDLNSAQLQAIAFCTIGVVIMFTTFPILVSQIIQLYSVENIIDGDTAFNTILISNLVATSLKVVLGLLLVLGAKFWVRLLHKFREFGLHEKTSNN